MRQSNKPYRGERCDRRGLMVKKDRPALTRETTWGVAVTVLFVILFFKAL